MEAPLTPEMLANASDEVLDQAAAKVKAERQTKEKAKRRTARRMSRTQQRVAAKKLGHKLGHNNVRCKRCLGDKTVFSGTCAPAIRSSTGLRAKKQA